MDQNGSIQASGLVRDFNGAPRAVDALELDIPEGEIYGFLGPNGAGKSTTVLMLTTLLDPTAGHARVAGYDVAREGHHVRGAIGAALQEVALDRALTGRDHLALQGALHGMGRRDVRRRGDELLERLGLTDAAARRVAGYSGGMKRRLDLALALLHRPRVLFLDEPTTGLDPQSRNALWTEVSRLARDEGVTTFLTTHYLEEADALANRVGIIDRGRLVAEGTPANLKARIGRPTVEAAPAEPGDLLALATVLERFGPHVPAPSGSVGVRLASHDDDLGAVVAALASEGLVTNRLQLHAPTLDDVFLTMTGRSLEGAAGPTAVVA